VFRRETYQPGGHFVRLRDIRYARFNSSVIRRFLTFFYQNGRIYQLWFGPLRGLRMRYNPTINFHAILGLWDIETFGLLNKLFVESGVLAKDSIVADIGGNVGCYAMWLSTVAAPKGRVYCFEPSPDTLLLLRDNLQINGIENVEVIESACGDHIGTACFFIAPHHHASSLHADWAGGQQARKITVRVTSLDAFFAPETARQPPVFIKIDIEGGGTYALPGCQRVLRETRPFILIESHTPDEDRAISNVLCEFNYRGYRLTNRRWVQRPQAVHPDADGVWGTVLLIPAERYARMEALISKI
jgi:FkbM family methyltransferase